MRKFSQCPSCEGLGTLEHLPDCALKIYIESSKTKRSRLVQIPSYYCEQCCFNFTTEKDLKSLLLKIKGKKK